MEQHLQITQLLDQQISPAFLVEDHIITYVNAAAQRHGISLSTPISELISIGDVEYAQFREGSLCLTLNINGEACSATALCSAHRHIFFLESPYDDPELRAFALAAQYLRDPLSGAMHCAEAMATDNAVPQLTHLNKSLQQLHRAICNMSDAALYDEIRPSRMELRDITSVFQEHLEKAAQLSQHAGRILEYRLPNTQIHTMIDSEKIERAIFNLISNAIKATKEGDKISVTLHQAGSKLYFCVSDTGNSLERSNIFNRYLREPGLEAGYTGLGLGLTIVRKAAAAHGGTLLLEKLPKGGAKFTMSLNVIQPDKSGLRSHVRLPVDYAGGHDHALLELSDVLPSELYTF